MSIYAKKKSYRQIYEEYHGPIGYDDQGRRLEIHHIDGNHNNNSINNLKLVTIQEHYNIHYSQGDWLACKLILSRIAQEPDTQSKLMTFENLKRVKNGTHPFLGGEVARQTQRKRVENKTHHLLKRDDGSSITSDRVKNGTHPLLGPANNKRRLAEGTHPTQLMISCVCCRKTTNIAAFGRRHKNCVPSLLLML